MTFLSEKNLIILKSVWEGLPQKILKEKDSVYAMVILYVPSMNCVWVSSVQPSLYLDYEWNSPISVRSNSMAVVINFLMDSCFLCLAVHGARTFEYLLSNQSTSSSCKTEKEVVVVPFILGTCTKAGDDIGLFVEKLLTWIVCWKAKQNKSAKFRFILDMLQFSRSCGYLFYLRYQAVDFIPFYLLTVLNAYKSTGLLYK